MFFLRRTGDVPKLPPGRWIAARQFGRSQRPVRGKVGPWPPKISGVIQGPCFFRFFHDALLHSLFKVYLFRILIQESCTLCAFSLA